MLLLLSMIAAAPAPGPWVEFDRRPGGNDAGRVTGARLRGARRTGVMTTDFIRGLKDNMPSTDDVLGAVGLQMQRSATTTTFNTRAAFALGALVGAVFTALYAPRPGHEVREELNERVRQWGERMGWSDRRAEDDEAAAH